MAPENMTVLVTGFGPFGGYEVNSSWIAVKELELLGLGSNINLVVYELPVEYDEIDKQVPQLWKTLDPHLVIHVGLSGIATCFTLEQVAHSSGYQRKDVEGKLPCNNQCQAVGPTVMKSTLDMKRIVESLKHHGVTAVTSKDAGRYLCEYIYYTSLSMKTSPSAFVHVPPLDKPYNSKELAQGLKNIILVMLKQMKHKETNLKQKIVQNLPVKLSH
uniref:Pyroglutamyl-peptidase 1-like n=1 Tax=Phallusia mammillata TaxID=59560 RepID=A0A6F9DNV2_9ASCI|nr:pyroglutamyl-peptidase 1-like [Phallusia mammillata]